MCNSNSFSQICGISLSIYVTKLEAGIKPTIFFCDTIRGAILHALTNHASTTPPSISPSWANNIITQRSLLNALLRYCNLDFAGQDKTGHYRRVVIPAFKCTMKWMLRKAVELTIFKKEPIGWVYDEHYRFESDEKAGKWFNDALQRWNKMRPWKETDGLPDLARLSLTDVDERHVKTAMAPMKQKKHTKKLGSVNKPRRALMIETRGKSIGRGPKQRGGVMDMREH